MTESESVALPLGDAASSTRGIISQLILVVKGFSEIFCGFSSIIYNAKNGTALPSLENAVLYARLCYFSVTTFKRVFQTCSQEPRSRCSQGECISNILGPTEMMSIPKSLLDKIPHSSPAWITPT